MADKTSDSVPGKLKILHEAGDTLQRTVVLTYKEDGLPVVLTGANIAVVISTTRHGAAIITLSIGTGITATDLAGGVFDIDWNSASMLAHDVTYYYKVVITFPGGTVETILEDEFATT